MTSLHSYLGMLLTTMLGCSSARLDPNTRAFTLYAPTVSSAAPQGIAGAPHTSTTPKKTAAKAGFAGKGTADSESASAPESAEPKPQKCSSLPDPAPTSTDRWLKLALRFDKGKLELAHATAQPLRKSETTKRVMGRFAAELWIGCELIDRVRFDFPLLAADPAKTSAHDPNFEAAGRFDTIIMIPDSDRATRLELIDRATDARKVLEWPLRQEP